MTCRRSELTFGLGLVAGALGGAAIARRMANPRSPHFEAWQRSLIETRGEAQAAFLIGRVRARYERLVARRPRFSHPALCGHMDKNILPGLALYRTLLEQNSDRESVLTEVESLFMVSFRRFRRPIRLLRYLPNPFVFLRIVTHWVMQREFPALGWEVEWVQDDERRLAYNVRRCFYLDVLNAYGAPELTPLYCAGDDWLFQALPPAICWERTGTLARGQQRCDFSWRSVKSVT